MKNRSAWRRGEVGAVLQGHGGSSRAAFRRRTSGSGTSRRPSSHAGRSRARRSADSEPGSSSGTGRPGSTTRVAPSSASARASAAASSPSMHVAADGDLDRTTGPGPPPRRPASWCRPGGELAAVDAEREEPVADPARPPGGDLGVAADVDRDGARPGLRSQVDVPEADRRSLRRWRAPATTGPAWRRSLSSVRARPPLEGDAQGLELLLQPADADARGSPGRTTGSRGWPAPWPGPAGLRWGRIRMPVASRMVDVARAT